MWKQPAVLSPHGDAKSTRGKQERPGRYGHHWLRHLLVVARRRPLRPQNPQEPVMSTTFSSDCAATMGSKQEHCLCAQMAEGFMRDATPEALREAADPACPACGGSGVETVETSDRPEMNLASGNARLLLCALRISDADLFGSVTI